ncbi:MAG: zinc-ribbon domain-containing protein [Clostridia bacterium]|nr:zinc-ribbon domain-containing protein [Clostridia bacterium]
MFCKKCGYKLKDEAVFCPSCGYKIEKEIKPTPQETDVVSTPTQETDNTLPTQSVCKQCGYKLKEGAVFCPSCGYKIEKETKPTPQETDVVSTPTQETDNTLPTQPTGKSNFFGFIALPLSILALCLCWAPVFNLVFSLFALIPSVTGIALKKKFPRKLGLTIMALVISIIALIISIIMLAYVIIRLY